MPRETASCTNSGELSGWLALATSDMEAVEARLVLCGITPHSGTFQQSLANASWLTHMAAAASAHKRVLVTGGTGLVGRAIEHVLKEDKHADEEWFFPSSKEGDLRCAHRHLPRFYTTLPDTLSSVLSPCAHVRLV